MTNPAASNDLVERTKEFIRKQVLPVEEQSGGDIDLAGGDDLREKLQRLARAEGLFAPHVSPDLGGLGLNMVNRAAIFEAAGYSLFGPMALNIAAPDEGNMHLLAHLGTLEQQEQYLRPLASGEVRSAFAMTEPSPGAGSDPSALATKATKVSGGWRINGSKWLITGAEGAGFFIIMARTSGAPGEAGGATMLLAPADAGGLVVGRRIPTLERSMVGGHCEVTFDDLELPDDAVLGSVDSGFANAQVRLGPARMTHVMRWLGSARRAHEVAVAYVHERELFGSRASELGMIQNLIAENEIDLAATRALLLSACEELDLGERASASTSIAKTFGAEAIFRVVDRSMQMCGGAGMSEELPLARLSREVRPFRVYDGPSEVHRWSIARGAVRRIVELQK